MKAIDLTTDPELAWKPFAPSAAEPWDAARVAHLHRRAGLGATWKQVVRDQAEGFERSLERVLQGETHGPDGQSASEFNEVVEAMVESARRRGGGIERVQLLWLFRLIFTPHPLAERMTLAWHTHFATSEQKVQDSLAMLDQNLAQRELWRAPFGQLVLRMLKDPAMLLWLDGFGSTAERPNENLARELLELFTLGEGHYTEADVKGLAHALTGWRSIRGDTTEALFDASSHEHGSETFLGQTGHFGVDDVARILVAQPAAARHVARRLFQTFVSDTDEPGDVLLEPLAQAMRSKDDLDVGRSIEIILRSRLFHSTGCRGRKVKAPVEFVIGAVRAAEVFDPPPDLTELELWLMRMGQRLFYPPNVAGWPGGLSWLRGPTLLARANFAAALVASPDDESRLRAAADRNGLRSCEAWSAAMETLLNGPQNATSPSRSASSYRAALRECLCRPEAQLA